MRSRGLFIQISSRFNQNSSWFIRIESRFGPIRDVTMRKGSSSFMFVVAASHEVQGNEIRFVFAWMEPRWPNPFG